MFIRKPWTVFNILFVRWDCATEQGGDSGEETVNCVYWIRDT